MTSRRAARCRRKRSAWRHRHGTCIECQLKPGEKAIAFQVDRVTGLDFLLQAGDHIDVVLGTTVQVLQPTADTVDASPGEQRFEPVQGLEAAKTVKTILTDKRVLYVSATRIRSTPSRRPRRRVRPLHRPAAAVQSGLGDHRLRRVRPGR